MFNYDNFFSDLQSDNYLKNFSIKNKLTTNNFLPQQINNNNYFQNTYQTQMGIENYLSNQIPYSNNFQHQNYPSDDSHHPFYLQQQQQQNSISQSNNNNNNNYNNNYNNNNKNIFRANSPSFVPKTNSSQSQQSSHQTSSQQQQSGLNPNSPNYSPSKKSSNFSSVGNNLDSFHRLSSLENSHYPSLNNNSPNNKHNNNNNFFNNNNKRNSKVENFEEEKEIMIEVWEENLEEEMKKICKLSEKFCVVGYDCEFPGVIYQPKEFDYKDTSLSYDYLKANVDNLEIIQIGISLSDFQGNHPLNSQNQKILNWQFNFKFDLNKNAHNLKSINLLKNAGIDFQNFSKFGINPSHFAQLFLQSGLVMNEKRKWITFHSMFDYGYLIKLLTSQPLPQNESTFFNLFHTFFPTSFDIKFFFHNFTSVKVGGLDSISKSFKLERKGVAHQAGSDACLTLHLFFSILKTYRNQWIDLNFQQSVNGSIFGLNYNVPLSKVF